MASPDGHRTASVPVSYTHLLQKNRQKTKHRTGDQQKQQPGGDGRIDHGLDMRKRDRRSGRNDADAAAEVEMCIRDRGYTMFANDGMVSGAKFFTMIDVYKRQAVLSRLRVGGKHAGFDDRACARGPACARRHHFDVTAAGLGRLFAGNRAVFHLDDRGRTAEFLLIVQPFFLISGIDAVENLYPCLLYTSRCV